MTAANRYPFREEMPVRDNTVEARRFGCPSCGGTLRYDIESRKLVCDQCGRTAMPSMFPDEAGDAGSETFGVTAYRCPSCGAEICSAGTDATSFCSFCGSDVVLEQRLSEMQRPSRIVPFSVTREKCEEIYRRYIRAHDLAPRALLRQAELAHFRPVYIPFWSYSVQAEGEITVEGSVRSSRRGGDVCQEEVRLRLGTHIRQDNILYDASVAFEDETAARLLHASENAVPFHPVYLSGMFAQAPDAPPDYYRNEAAAAALRLFMDRVHMEYRMDSVRLVGDSLPDERIDQELVLMPVWLLARRQGDRVLYAAVNGADGRVVCDVPASPVKLGLATAAAAALLFALLIMLPTIRADWLIVPSTLLALLTHHRLCIMQRLLVYRELREGEPAFNGSAYRNGPAQTLLALHRYRYRKDGQDPPIKQVGKVLMLLAVGPLVLLLGYLLAATDLYAGDAALRLITAVFLLIAGVIGHRLSIRLIRAMPACRAKLSATRQCLLLIAVNILAILLLILNLAEDWVYYLVSLILLGLSVGGMVLLWRHYNRFATRPVPFFDKEEAA